MSDFAVIGGELGDEDRGPAVVMDPRGVEDRRRPVWVVPDEVPAIVPRPARHTEARWVSAYRRNALVVDLLAASAGAALALVVRFGAQVGIAYILLGCVLPLTWLACVAFDKGYDARYFGTGPEEFRSILRAGAGLTALVAIASYATKSSVARGFVLLAIPTTVLAAAVGRHLLRRRLAVRRTAGDCMRRVLVVGRNGAAATLVRHLSERRADGYEVVGVCRPRDEYPPTEQDIPELAAADILAAVDARAADVVAIAADQELAGHSLRRLSWALEQRGVELIVSPGIVEVAGPRISVRPVAGMSLLHLERPSVSGGPNLLKNVFDRVCGVLLLIGAAPVMLTVAVAIKLTSKGPVLFRQRRVGLAGAEFSMLKFRSMCVDAEARKAELHALNEGNEVLFKLRDDPRVTKVGKVIRRFSLDELPQLFNVLRGEMSLVGPRPPLPSEVARYEADAGRRMLVKPGLTGLWQVSGRSDLSWEESMRLDLRYVDNWSIALDLVILWRTFRAVAGRDGAY